MEDFSSLSNYIAYFGMIFNLVLIAMSIFATTYASGIIGKEEKTKSIEFLTSLHVSRLEIYASKVLASFVALLAVIASTMASAMLCGFLNGGETFVLMDLIAIIKISSMSAFVFMAVGLCLGGVSGKLGTSAIGSMVVVVSYVLGYLSVLLDGKATWLQYASPFEVLSPSNALAMSSHTLIGAMVYCFLMVALVIIGGMRYQKRDFVI